MIGAKIQAANGNCKREDVAWTTGRDFPMAEKHGSALRTYINMCARIRCGKERCMHPGVYERREVKFRKLLDCMFKLLCSAMYCTVLYL